MRARPYPLIIALCLAAAALLAGCGGRATLDAEDRPATRPVADLGTGYFEPRLEAFVVPPAGWQPQPFEKDEMSVQRTWVSPTGDSAYGVFHFQAPAIVAFLPKGEFLHNRAVGGMMEEMEKREGSATLIEQSYDERLNAARTVAEAGRFRLRTILRVRGREGWGVFAGSLVERPENAAELAIAERAREATRVGLDAEGGAKAAEAALRGAE